MLGLYNGEGERELGKYNSFFNHDLKPSEYKRSDGYQFSEANKALHERFQKDEKFAKMMNKKYPVLSLIKKVNIVGNLLLEQPGIMVNWFYHRCYCSFISICLLFRIF
jgi:putative rhs-family protein